MARLRERAHERVRDRPVEPDHERTAHRRGRQRACRRRVRARAVGSRRPLPTAAVGRRAGVTRANRGGAAMSAWNSKPVVLTVAVTGADVFRENNPNIPYTTEEIAEHAIDSAAAGATVVHLHVREDDGTPSGRPELFQDVIRRIRAGSDLLTMVSTGGSATMTIEERTTGLDAGPDLSGVETGSMNFGDDTFITPPPAGRGIVARALSMGIGLGGEGFDVGPGGSGGRWVGGGPPPAPPRVNPGFGGPGGG